MKLTTLITKTITAFTVLGLALAFSSCGSTKTASSGVDGRTYDTVAYKPKNQANVRVKASVNNRAVYVMEGDRVLLATPACLGAPGHGTPMGNHRAYARIRNKRSYSYGKYPMPYWVEFRPGYGFHGGWVHNSNKSHGCVRLPWNVAPKFWNLVPLGTPINVAMNQPEDATAGRSLKRLADEAAPEWPKDVLWTDRVFHLNDDKGGLSN